jgi:RTX calcium-binding nonapeptide repeat (4 copies)
VRRLAGVLAVAGAVTIGAASAATGSKPKPPTCFGVRATIVGTPTDDFLDGTPHADVIVTMGGADRIAAGSGNDLICSGLGEDTVDGGPGNDRIDAGPSGDIVDGGTGRDVVSGGPGFDTCRNAERRSGCESALPPLPGRPGPIRAGVYATDLFRPRFSIQLEPGWNLGHNKEDPLHVSLTRPELITTDETGLWFDSLSSATPVEARAAEITSVAALGAGPVTPTSVGGAPGMQFDIVPPAGTPETFIPGMTQHYFAEGGEHGHIWLVDVHGATVTISAGGDDEEHFAALLPLAERAVATVHWLR